MPCYNVEAYLEKGLSSLADEQFNNKLEVLIVDDGSSDSTPQIAQRFAERYPRIFRLIQKENGGHGSVINTGIKEARGKYFRIIDGDDWVDTDALAQLLDVLACTRADIVIDERVEVDMTSSAKTYRKHDIPCTIDMSLPFDELCTDARIADAIFIHMLNVKTSLLREHDICVLEGVFYEDYEYICKTTAFAHTIMFVQLPVYHYLVGNASQSVSDANYAKRWDDHICVLKEVLRFYAEDTHNLTQNKRIYLARKNELIINTLYNIALIFDADRKRGACRAKELRAYLCDNYPEFATRTSKRYNLSRFLHALGINSQKKLDALTGRK